MIRYGKFSICLILGCFLLFSCEKNQNYDVEYKLSGTSSQGYQVTYYDQNNNVKQDTGVDSGWSYKFTAEESFFAYVSGFTSHDSSDITVSILVNGSIFDSESDAGYKITVTASGNIP